MIVPCGPVNAPSHPVLLGFGCATVAVPGIISSHLGPKTLDEWWHDDKTNKQKQSTNHHQQQQQSSASAHTDRILRSLEHRVSIEECAHSGVWALNHLDIGLEEMRVLCRIIWNDETVRRNMKEIHLAYNHIDDEW